MMKEGLHEKVVETMVSEGMMAVVMVCEKDVRKLPCGYARRERDHCLKSGSIPNK